MGLTIQQDQPKVKATFRFQTNAELRDVQLLNCTASMGGTLEPPEGEVRLALQLETNVLSSPEGSVRLGVRIRIFRQPKDEVAQGEKPLFEVACQYALHYELRPGYVPSQEDLDAFREGNAIFHCWPYFRELVQNLTMRMGLQIPPLPVLRLAPKPAAKKHPIRRHVRRQEKAVADRGDSGS